LNGLGGFARIKAKEKSHLLNKAGKKPSFSSTCELRGLGNQKLGFLRPEILRRYEKFA